MQRLSALAAVCTAFLLTGSLGLTPATDAPSADPPTEVAIGAPSWASPSTATIRGGVQVVVGGAQCTSNFVFYDATDVYLGMAAHCATLGSSTQTTCTTPVRAPGTTVWVEGAQFPAQMSYNSWYTMQQEGEPWWTDACYYNDFALVKLDPRDHKLVYPGLLHFGGPTGLAKAWHHEAGDAVHSYGRSGLRPLDSPLDWKSGWIWASCWCGWTTTIYTESPGIPGDSGSPVLLGDGRAHGVVSTLQILPWTGANGVSVLDKDLDYMKAKAGSAPTLATAPLEFPLLVPDLS